MLLFAKEVQLFPCLVLYCGIFALYLVFTSGTRGPRPAVIIFCALILLFVLSTVTFIADLVKFILEKVLLVSNNSISKIFFLSVVQFHLSTTSSDSRLTLTIIQATASGFCDFLAQCILVRINHYPFYSLAPKYLKIYRCWIIWGGNIRVVILPSILAITYLGQSIYYLHFNKLIQFIASSYLDRDRSLSISFTSSTPILWCMGVLSASNKFRRVHGREYPSDGLDRVQDP